MPKKNYSLREIKEELWREIGELEKLDPSYRKCRSCPFQGKCCLDNDIDIREDEWEEIQGFLEDHPERKEKVRENFLTGRKCYFHTSSMCLIAEVRPTNCLYTPYQAILTYPDQDLLYSFGDEDCDFTLRREKHVRKEDLHFLSPYLLYLPRAQHYYLYLNDWVDRFERNSVDGFKMLGEERLKEYFSE